MGAEPLLKIESVPISFEYVESTKPTSHSQSTAKLEITRDRETNNVNIHPQRLHLNMDGFSRSNGKDAVSLDNLSYTATASYDGLGNFRLNVNLSDAMTSDLRYSQVGRDTAAMADTIGTGSNDAEFVNYFPMGDSSISINFDLSGLYGLEDATFEPPELELKVKEMPHLVITYTGGPLYFPKSADPNYQPKENGTLDLEA